MTATFAPRSGVRQPLGETRPTTAAAEKILRHADDALAQGEKSAGRLALALLEESAAFGAIAAAQILRERLAPGRAAANLRRAA
jgi:hypothetical protein